MGLFELLFGGGRNRIVETAEVFRANAEKSAHREAAYKSAALEQYAAEFFDRTHRTWADVFTDSLNRLIRPLVTLAVLYPIPATVIAPEEMAKVWLAIATLPNGYWAIVGIVLPFYFGGRMQVKALASAKWMAAAEAARGLIGGEAVPKTGANPALDAWRKNASG